MKNILLTIVLSAISAVGFSQGSCASPMNIGTPTSTQSCVTFSNGTVQGSGCTGGGYGGGASWGVTFVRFCTNANADCINFNFTNGTASGNMTALIYTTGCAFTGQGSCMGTTGTGSSFNTGGMGLSPNTCYIARIAIANPGTMTMCTEAMAPANDGCSGATPISSTPQALNNFCTTPASTTPVSPAVTPAQLCAGSLENTAWYQFTVLADGTVVITIDNITCTGGGAGFQIGAYTGSCGALNNIGCASGAGGTVTLTITGLTAGQVVYIAIDGNAGANCTYDMDASNTVPLPIGLLSFSAEPVNNAYVDLNWITESELNNDYFSIERSIDGTSFEVIGVIDGAGNSTMVNEYSTEDTKPHKGVSYYRLKQTDYDGEFTYSRILSVEVKGSFEELAIYPNPVEGESHLTFNSNFIGLVNVSIMDVSGRIVLEHVLSADQGTNTIKLNTDRLTQGMYFLTIGNDDEMEQVKFIKN